MKRVISVWLPTLPTDRLRKQYGAPAPEQPFITVAKDGTRQIVDSADKAARLKKIIPGQTLSHARMLITDLHEAEAEIDADAKALFALAAKCMGLYSPMVSITEPDTIWIDATGCAHLFGGEEAMLRDLQHMLYAKGFTSKIGLADTVGAAYAAARWSRTSCTVVPEQEQKQFLADLPLAALRIPFEKAETLLRLGFRQIKQLYGLPRAPFTRRFGKELLEQLDMALGQRAEPLQPITIPEMPHVHCAFVEPVSNPDFLAHRIDDLAVALCRQLALRELGARRLDLIFHRVDSTTQWIRVGTVSATRDPKHITRLLAQYFDKIEYGFGIESLRLNASLIEELSATQVINPLGEKPANDLNILIDILQNRLGPSSVYRFSAIESYVPERSAKRIAPADKSESAWDASLPRPMRLLPHPEKVEALALLPDHAPTQFTWRQARYRILHAEGPERIFGEWWKEKDELMAVRDYFRVEDESGGTFWLFRRGDGADPRTGTHEWFLHGIFG